MENEDKVDLDYNLQIIDNSLELQHIILLQQVEWRLQNIPQLQLKWKVV